jgi:hypothetical protein
MILPHGIAAHPKCAVRGAWPSRPCSTRARLTRLTLRQVPNRSASSGDSARRMASAIRSLICSSTRSTKPTNHARRWHQRDSGAIGIRA